MKIVHTNKIPEVSVSHNKHIKKVFLEKGFIPQLYTFSSAVFKPGQSVDTHKHDIAFETFYILEGKIDFVVNNKKFTLEKGDCITIEPKENHSQNNPYNKDAKLLYFGIEK